MPFQFNSSTDSAVPRILERMDKCAYNLRTDEKAKDISWLISKICKAMTEEVPDATWEPILTGSDAACTQALFINEFDYVLLTNSTINHYVIKHALESVVSKMNSMHHPRLSLESMNILTVGRLYPCLYITWVDEHLRNTHISIDLVLANPLGKPVTLPHHNFLPLPRQQQPGPGDDGDSYLYKSQQHRYTKILAHHHDMPGIARERIPRLFSELYAPFYNDRETVFSPVENCVILFLPSYIFEGYRLSKAFRITHVIRPIIQKLIDLGVTLDIHKIIKTYPLKTCVFYLTQNYICDGSDAIVNRMWAWAIAIFEKLREFVMLGDVKEFFATDLYVFGKVALECKHDEEDFTASLPRFICCRRRKARLLVVD